MMTMRLMIGMTNYEGNGQMENVTEDCAACCTRTAHYHHHHHDDHDDDKGDDFDNDGDVLIILFFINHQIKLKFALFKFATSLYTT